MMSALAACALGCCWAGALKSRSKMLDWGWVGEVAAAVGPGGAAPAVVVGLRAAGAVGGEVGAAAGAEGVSSPNRSIMGAGAGGAGFAGAAAVGRFWRERRGCGRAPGAAGGGETLVVGVARGGGERDCACGCCSTGEAALPPPPSSTEGSRGGGPSIAQRRDSYFERMNDSILLRVSD